MAQSTAASRRRTPAEALPSPSVRNVTASSGASVTVTRTDSGGYQRGWPAYNAAQTEEKATFQTLLHDLCAGIPQPAQHMGRKRHPLADVVFSAAFKVYSTVSARRFTTDLRDAAAKGYITRAIPYNTLFRYFESEELTPLLQDLVATSALPLAAVETNFAVDSTGFTTTRFVRWFDHKWGDIKEQHDWKKVHAMCGVTTNVVTAVRVSDGHANDSPFFAPLVAETAQRFRLDEVSADMAYSSRKNTLAVWNADAMPYIPYPANTSALGTKPGSQLWRRLFHYYNLERDDFLAHYHKRSNVETAFHMMKAKFGDALRSKTKVAQFNEALLKVLCHNICCVIQSMHELGVSPDFGAAQAV